jgi:hypothetical protein
VSPSIIVAIINHQPWGGSSWVLGASCNKQQYSLYWEWYELVFFFGGSCTTKWPLEWKAGYVSSCESLGGWCLVWGLTNYHTEDQCDFSKHHEKPILGILSSWVNLNQSVVMPEDWVYNCPINLTVAHVNDANINHKWQSIVDGCKLESCKFAWIFYGT